MREAARLRQQRLQFERNFEKDWEAHQDRLRKWQLNRCIRAAKRLGIEPEALTPMALGFASATYADVDGLDDAPEFRMDRRRGPRWAQ